MSERKRLQANGGNKNIKIIGERQWKEKRNLFKAAFLKLDKNDKQDVSKTGYVQPTETIELVINADTPYQIDPHTGAYIVEVTQCNEEQTGSLTLTFSDLIDTVTGDDSVDTGIRQEFVNEKTKVEGAVFELYAKNAIYSPDVAVNEEGNRIVRYEKDDLVAALTLVICAYEWNGARIVVIAVRQKWKGRLFLIDKQENLWYTKVV